MSRGHDRERLVRDLLESGGGPYAGPWWVSRAAGSLGDADLVAAKASFALTYSRLLLIEVKSTAASPYEHFGPRARNELAAAADLAGAEAWLCWTPKSKPGVAGIHGCWIPESEWPPS